MRPGRFDRHIYVSLPDLDARIEIFAINARTMPFDPTVDIAKLAGRTIGYSGAEIAALCQEAARVALKRSIDATTVSFFLITPPIHLM